ncbi:MAG: serine/threonine-protein kinase [Planctomycetota bacterium]|jgi:tetratricopeptide (TPR) repeat protein/tRNA A-37 threonylcarbamoyl transferase component Bud32
MNFAEEHEKEELPEKGETLLRHTGDTKPGMAPRSPDEEKTVVPGQGSILDTLRERMASGGEILLRAEEEAHDMVAGVSGEDRYTVLDEIARGGMGAIVKLVDNDIRRPVAMKVILGEEAGGRLERFVEEAQVTGQLEHPNIVPVHELGVDDKGKVYFTMKLVKGESLERVIDGIADRDEEALRTYTLSHLLQIFLKVCDAVAFAHSRGVIHRDLKPENVMIGRFGEVLVLDWGLAKVDGEEDRNLEDLVATVRSEKETGKSLTGDVMGTPSYMPPEQADGRVEEVDERSDVFALGGILYRILCHEAPYTGETVTNVMMKAVEGRIVPPRRRSPYLPIPAELESICMKAAARCKADRYPSVEALIEDIRAYLDRRLVGAHRYSAFARLVRFIQRHPAASLGTGVGTVVLAIGAATTYVMAARAETNAAMARAADAERLMETHKRREAEADARTATADARQAKDALTKGRLVSAVLQAADFELGKFALKLKQLRARGALPEKRKARFEGERRRINVFRGSLKKDDASQAAWLALSGWLLFLAGDEEGAIQSCRQAVEKDRDVPYGALFEAMIHLVRYMDLQRHPIPYFAEIGLRFEEVGSETEEMKGIRRLFEERIGEAKEAKVWGESSATDFADLLEGLRGINLGKHWASEAHLAKALVVPEFRWVREEIRETRMKVRFHKWDMDGGLEDAETILDKLPGNRTARLYGGLLHIGKGWKLTHEKKDPLLEYEEALRYFGAAIKSNPRDPTAWIFKSITHRRIGLHLHSVGRDASESYEQSVEDATRALGYADRLSKTYIRINRGMTWILFARVFQRRGEPSSRAYEKAIEDFDAMIEARPGSIKGHFQRGDALRRLGDALKAEGRDPEPSYRRAVKDMEISLGKGRKDLGSLYLLGRTWMQLGRHLFEMGRTPRKEFENIIEPSRVHIELDRLGFKGRLNLGRAHLWLAKCDHRSRKEPRENIGKALEELGKILKDFPDCWMALRELGEAHAFRAELAREKRVDPRPFFEQAIESFAKALEINPDSLDSLARRGELRRRLATENALRKADPRPGYRAAIEDLSLYRSKTPANTWVLDELGIAWVLLGQTLQGRREDPREAYEKASAMYGKAVELQGAYGVWHHRLATVLTYLADATRCREGEAVKHVTKALMAYDATLALEPKNWQAQAGRAELLQREGRFEEALKGWERVGALTKGTYRGLDGHLRVSKALAGQPEWGGDLWRAEQAFRAGAWVRARKLYAMALPEAESSGLLTGEANKKLLAGHYQSFARALSLNSIGRLGQLGGGRAVPAEKRESLQVQAVEVLGKAFECGMSPSVAETDPWLEALRSREDYKALTAGK